MCCGDVFCTGIHNLLTVVEVIDVCRTFAWLPCCDTEYFCVAAMCPAGDAQAVHCGLLEQQHWALSNSAAFMSICTNSEECKNGMCLNAVA